MTDPKSSGLALEWSHERVRPVLRVDESTPSESVDAAPMNDPETGRFVPGNRAHRRRWLKERADGIATLNPATAPTWTRPYVEQGRPYVVALLLMLDGRTQLHPLAGDVADAHVLFKATMALALQTEDPKARAALMSEARGWLREHRTALATLSALAGGMRLPEPGDAPPGAGAEEPDPFEGLDMAPPAERIAARRARVATETEAEPTKEPA